MSYCYLCHAEIPAGSRNYFDADGIATHLVCPGDDPTGEELGAALQERLLARRKAVLGR